jgi:ABC-type amino acid transport substrate-binding protein
MYRSAVANILTLAVLLVVMPSLPVACAETLPETQTVLKSASELDYPPFAIVQPDGTAGGFSVDLLKAATEAVGLSVTFKVGPWNEIKQELAEKTLDVLPLVSYSEERSKVYDFTTAYLRMNGTVFIRKGTTEIKGLDDLKNKEVLVMQGDTAHEYALRENLSDTIIAKASYDEAFKLLASGKHDAIVVQQIVGLQIIKKLHITNVVPVEQKNISSIKPMALKLEGFEQKFCFAVPEGNKQLLAQLNEGLAIISLNGTYNLLYEQWFAPILPKPQVTFGELVKQTLSILVPLLFFIMFFGLWYLKRLVTKRTQYLQLEIHQRKQAEKELQESHDLLANLARLVPGVVYQYRLFPDGRSAFPYASPGMNSIYEVTPEEVREDATPVFGRLHPDDFDTVASSIQESARTLETFYCEFQRSGSRKNLS